MTRRTARSRLLLALTLTSACASELRDAPELLVSVTTDLAPEELTYLRIETLDVQGELAVDTRWLRVGDACTEHDDGLRMLGTFSVQQGDQSLSRLRVTALRAEPDGTARELGSQRVDAVFARGRVPVALVLARVCSQIVCNDGTTCDALTGACHDVQRLEQPPARGAATSEEGCLAPLTEPPPPLTTPAHMPSTASCIGGDGRCDAPCEGSRDSDCLRARGQPCLTTAECVADAFCVHGFCCDQPCAGGCERCDLPEQPGRCAPLVYAATTAPLSSPDFVAECGETRVHYACSAGICTSSCAAGYGDCDGALQDNGCETALGSVNHCRACGDACLYGYCDDFGCTWHHTSGLATSDSRPVATSKLYATDLLVSSNDRVVRALGVLVHPELAGSELRLALYAGNAAGSPDRLLAQTSTLPVVDSARSLIPKQERVIRVEGIVTRVQLVEGTDYFVAVQVAQNTQIYAEASTLAVWHVAPQAYGAFPTYFANPAEFEESVMLTIYAITTPN